MSYCIDGTHIRTIPYFVYGESACRVWVSCAQRKRGCWQVGMRTQAPRLGWRKHSSRSSLPSGTVRSICRGNNQGQRCRRNATGLGRGPVGRRQGHNPHRDPSQRNMQNGQWKPRVAGECEGTSPEAWTWKEKKSAHINNMKSAPQVYATLGNSKQDMHICNAA